MKQKLFKGFSLRKRLHSDKLSQEDICKSIDLRIEELTDEYFIYINRIHRTSSNDMRNRYSEYSLEIAEEICKLKQSKELLNDVGLESKF
jgi:hypothetical protein